MRTVHGFLLAAGLAICGGCGPQATPVTADSAGQKTTEATVAIEPADHSQREDPAPSDDGDPIAEQPDYRESPDTAPPTGDAVVRPVALRPKADRGAAPEGVEKITFDDLILGMQADMVFRPWMLESETNGGRAKELDGKRVRLSGIMHGGVGSTEKNKDFVLLRNKECKFGPGGQADHLAKVFMKKGKTAPYTGDATVRVEGTLRIKPSMGEDGNTWSIYELEEAELK